MNIWLIKTGEPLPTDGDDARLLRTGMLAEALVKRGHKIVFWSSTFNHREKAKRVDKTTVIPVSKKYELCLLDAPPYQKNVSLKRIWHNRVTAKRFSEQALLRDKPDVIVCAYPTIELSCASTAFGQKYDVPVILDIRDLWPDLFYEVVPRVLRPLANIFLKYFDRQARKAILRAKAVTGITDAFVKWGLQKGGLTYDPLSNPAFHLAYSSDVPPHEDVLKAEEFWDSLGVGANGNYFIACMIGNLSFNCEVDVLVQVMDLIPLSTRDRFRIVICGTGVAHQHLRNLSKPHPQIIFPGWVDKAKIWVLMRRSSVGVVPYFSTQGFQYSLPNKVGEYLSAGLPILSSVQGVLSKFLEKNGCGRTYPNGDSADLAMNLIELQQNPSKCAQLSAHARDMFLKEFEAELVMGNYCEFIEKIGLQSCARNPIDD
ncbi:MAG: glycosyltransferase family 4 protein [Rhodospirillales bacterium]|nr:glycosyltransferase family 4 protein [Rhodospirillales bacterium]